MAGGRQYDCKKIEEDTERVPETEDLNIQMDDLPLSIDSGLGFESLCMHDEKCQVGSPVKDEDANCQVGGHAKDKKKKKKKKSKVGGQSPSRIIAFNAAEQQKLQESKSENQRSIHERKLLKSSTFPGPDFGSIGFLTSIESSSAGQLQAEGCEESEASDQSICSSPDSRSSVLMRSNSLPVKPALRGSREELGLGPRPKLHVKWAPDVLEPAHTSISHTVSRNRFWCHSKKKDYKHHHKGKSSHADSCNHHKGKSSHADSCKKHEKKHSQKSRYSSETSILRTQCAFSHLVGHKGDLHPGCKPTCLVLSNDETIRDVPLPLTVTQQASSHTSHGWADSSGSVIVCETGPEKCFDITAADRQPTLVQGVLDTELSLSDSKCAGSFLGFHGLQCKLIYGEAI